MKKAAILFCGNCGKSIQTVKQWRKNGSIGLICDNCGNMVSLKNGSISIFEIEEKKLSSIAGKTEKPPEEYLTTEKQRESAKKNQPKASDGWFTLRHRVTEGQRELYRKATKLIKEYCGYTGRMWHGKALEYMCAEIIATLDGATATGLQIVPELFIEKNLKCLKNSQLSAVANFVFSSGQKNMFDTEESLIDWIMANVPKEYTNESESDIEQGD